MKVIVKLIQTEGLGRREIGESIQVIRLQGKMEFTVELETGGGAIFMTRVKIRKHMTSMCKMMGVMGFE